ncbi:MAG: DUF600 family protein [Clostridia bacterium]|nr:DUF600 family protein [Clostridia bacterium]
MIEHTQKIKELYEDIQRKLFYMIPEKWDKLYLYASVMERLGNVETGELYFYYIPKGILKKNPINVYEVPAKFNLDEKEYIKLVEKLYNTIKELRMEFKKVEPLKDVWSNVTISIQNNKFKVEYGYEDLLKSKFSSYERHIIWRSKYLNIGVDRCNKQEKEVLKQFIESPEVWARKEKYETGIYIQDIQNIVDFDTQEYKKVENIENFSQEEECATTNQILMYNKEKN